MSKSQNLVLHSAGNAWAGNDTLFDVLNFELEIGLETIDAALRGGNYIIPVRQPITGRVTAAGMNLNLLSRLTGGTITTSSSTAVVDETLTKSTNTLTLSQTPVNTDAIRITPIGSDKSPLVQVASSPAVGEYSISGTTVTLNASQTETQFKCEYLYADSSNGETLQIDPDDLPSTFAYYGVVKAEDVFPGTAGHLVVELAKVQRTGSITIGGSQDTAQTFSFEVNVINTSFGDVKLSYKAAS